MVIIHFVLLQRVSLNKRKSIKSFPLNKKSQWANTKYNYPSQWAFGRHFIPWLEDVTQHVTVLNTSTMNIRIYSRLIHQRCSLAQFHWSFISKRIVEEEFWKGCSKNAFLVIINFVMPRQSLSNKYLALTLYRYFRKSRDGNMPLTLGSDWDNG